MFYRMYNELDCIQSHIHCRYIINLVGFSVAKFVQGYSININNFGLK